jgi:hypothetical protein
MRNPSALVAPVSFVGARCPQHLEQSASGACARCGAFFCSRDEVAISGKKYCGECGKRPELNYLEQMRLKYWGARDSWTYLIAIGTLSDAAQALASMVQLSPAAVVFAAIAAIKICFFLGLPFARRAILAVPSATMFGILLVMMMEGKPMTGPVVGVLLGTSIFPTLILLAITHSTRNKLFFKVEVPEAELKKLWSTYHDNPLARTSALVGVIGLVVPLIPLVAMALGGIALRRVNPHSMPPVGRQKTAIAGVVLGVLGVTMQLGLLVTKL